MHNAVHWKSLGLPEAPQQLVSVGDGYGGGGAVVWPKSTHAAKGHRVVRELDDEAKVARWHVEHGLCLHCWGDVKRATCLLSQGIALVCEVDGVLLESANEGEACCALHQALTD